MTSETRMLREALLALAGSGSAAHHGAEGYTGSPDAALSITTPDLRRLARRWVSANRNLEPSAVLASLDELFAGHLHEEKTLAALILGYAPLAQRATTPARLEAWLGRLTGWAQIDSLCSNIFQADQLLDDWAAWGSWLFALAADPDINKRRASLVILTGPVRYSDDPRLAGAAFANIAALQGERAILITKAISWLLRNLTLRHRQAVVAYVAAHRAALPAIAVREVRAKLETGRKNPRATG